ncbi:hypothetical protein RJ641_023432 [Dillenia turbinata]|uniref:Uncharacterized protein n=1 Tax=Dillenia turbinata TaxID=194707 RepID=A0AAN8YQE2_9MAGN
MEPFGDVGGCSWDLLDFSLIEEATCSDFYWSNNGSCVGVDASPICIISPEKGTKRKRFADLSSLLEPGSPAKTDKSAILNDAIHALQHLRTEVNELKEQKEKLQADIKNLKEEKNELREEKVQLKAEKEKMEQMMKATHGLPAKFMPAHAAPYLGGANKLMVIPSFGGYPMWQWIPPAVLDTSQDHVLRPPVA